MYGSVTVIVLLAGPCFCKAQDSAWERVGPGGGGATFRPTFSYRHPNEFLLRCDMTGTYHTQDGGQSYRQVNFPNGAHSFAFDPANGKVIYIGSSVLYRSSDGGDHWDQVYPKPDQVLGRSYSGDHAEMSIEVAKNVRYWPAGEVINAIKVDSSNIYFAVGHSLFYSRDRGETWATKDLHVRLLDLYIYQGVYIFSADSIYRLDKEKITASALPSVMEPVAHFAAGRTKQTGSIIFYALSAHAGIWMSHDLGKTWSRSNSFPVAANATAIACAEFDASKAYVVVDRLEEGPQRIWYGVWRTRDNGDHWDWVWRAGGGTGQYGVPDAQNAGNLDDGWAGRAFGKEFVQVLDVGVSPCNGDTAVITDWYRVMKTTDGGRSWKSIYSHDYADGRAASTGLDVTTTYGVHFDPYDHKHIAMSCTDIGYHHSFDGGKTWMRAVSGVPSDWVNTCYWVAFDPTDPGKLWSAWSGIHDLPRGKMTRDPQWKTRCTGGACVSTDGGRSWTPLVNGMDRNSATTCIVVDPLSPAGNRTLYATVYNKGVFKSVDDGKTWVQKNNGIGDNTRAFRIAVAGNGDLYLVTSPGAVYKSTDGADSWSKLALSEDDAFFPSGVTVDPLDPQRVYVGCWAGGIFLSEDGGQHWTSIFDKKNYVYDVAVDPHHPGRIYCNTFTGAAWRSDDYGRNWRRIQGYDFHWGHRVIVDENDPDKVYLTTYGSGVWHGYPRPTDTISARLTLDRTEAFVGDPIHLDFQIHLPCGRRYVILRPMRWGYVQGNTLTGFNSTQLQKKEKNGYMDLPQYGAIDYFEEDKLDTIPCTDLKCEPFLVRVTEEGEYRIRVLSALSAYNPGIKDADSDWAYFRCVKKSK
ncbi:MAG: hypothetical protein BGO55_24935 [Sphingobacteriales bacterium 50-39]|nr:MAG: hypothetical protein BGO55_24935 [Sphingobacteriales bacterium 50-39]